MARFWRIAALLALVAALQLASAAPVDVKDQSVRMVNATMQLENFNNKPPAPPPAAPAPAPPAPTPPPPPPPPKSNATQQSTAPPPAYKHATAWAIKTCSKPGTFALTFDDGPNIWVDAIRKALNDNGVKGTFFVNGNNLQNIWNYKSQLNALINDGHQLASHTWSHCDLNKGCDLAKEIEGLEDAVFQLTGKKMRYFRPPYGNLPDYVLQYVTDRDYVTVIWNADTLDWEHPNDPAGNVKRALDAIDQQGGYNSKPIVLSHETVPTVVDEIWRLVQGMHDRGLWQGVTVADCMDQGPAYR